MAGGTEAALTGGETVTAGTETSANGVIPSNGGEAMAGGTEAPINAVGSSNDIDPTDIEIEEVEDSNPSTGGVENSPSPAIPSNGVQLNDETFIADFKNIEGNLTASDPIIENGVYEINTAKGTSIYARDAAGEKIALFMEGARLKATGTVELFADSEGTTMQFMEVMYKGKAYMVSKLHMMKV